MNPHNVAALDTVLTYHVANGAVLSNTLKDGQMIPTLEKEDVTVHIAGGVVSINNARVLAADNLATNGVVHIVSEVRVGARGSLNGPAES